jgi:dihydrolipoamide dehydrogenase
VAQALARRDRAASNYDDASLVPWLEERGVHLVRGHGRIAGELQVEVGGATLTAGLAVVIATGSRASLPPIEGLADAKPWTNHEATAAKAVPQRLVVLGGGPIGVELAQGWRSLGAEVVVLEGMERLLGREEPFAGEQVEAGLREMGIEVRTGVQATAVRREGDGRVTVVLEGGDEVSGSELLVAVGRTANSDDIGLDSVGVTKDAGLGRGGTIDVDGLCRVGGREWLYAVGDVNGRELLTHMAKKQARVAADHILGDAPEPLSFDAPPPRVTVSDPQVAAVGHTKQSAEDAGLEVRVVDADTGATPGSSFVGKGAPGTSRLVLDVVSGVVYGATFVGPEVAEWLHAATIAVTARLTIEQLAAAVAPFPTRSEVWLRLEEAAGL